ncbi:hypothetical protein GOP47_0026295 [Adiantum capillus-veneris]|nr:hypothetical protein GOP47_0026295 [Adiantum capillus-veneris]
MGSKRNASDQSSRYILASSSAWQANVASFVASFYGRPNAFITCFTKHGRPPQCHATNGVIQALYAGDENSITRPLAHRNTDFQVAISNKLDKLASATLALPIRCMRVTL